MVETVKYNSYEKVEMLSMLIHRSLAMSVGATDPCQTRHIAAVGVRFQLLQCGLSLLQGDVLTKSLAKNVLRERIYYSCLDYFCRPRLCPTQPFNELKEDLIILIKFWQSMHSDKKYLRASHVGDLDITATTPPGNGTNEFSKPANEIAKPATGWINTVPLSASTATLSKRSAKSTKRVPMADNFVKCYMKKRNLILELLAVEIEMMIVWYNPTCRGELLLAGEENLATWSSKTLTDKQWQDFTRLAWEISPVLAIYLPERLKAHEAVINTNRLLVAANPLAVAHIPDGKLDFFKICL